MFVIIMRICFPEAVFVNACLSRDLSEDHAMFVELFQCLYLWIMSQRWYWFTLLGCTCRDGGDLVTA